MSIEEKLSTVAENTPKVYNQGYEDGKNSVVDVSRCCSTITFTDLNSFGSETVTLNLDNLTNLTTLVDTPTTTNTTLKHLIVNCKKPITKFDRVFVGRVPYLERVTLNVDLSQATQITDIFWSYIDLKIVDGTPLDLSVMLPNRYVAFSCPKLQEIRFVKETIKIDFKLFNSPLLSAESIQSIIDGLADLTGGTAQTLTLHANVGAKLTDEQKATITAKNWTLVY